MGHQITVVSSKIAIFASCSRYVFRNFIYDTILIMSEYVVPQWLLSTSKQMTLKIHFALNTHMYCFLSESFSVDALVLRHDCIGVNTGGTRGTRPPRNHSAGDANVIRPPQILTN